MRLPGKLLQKALCTAPATQKGSAEALCTAPARQKAAAGQRRPPRRSSARKLCVLRVPRKREVRRLLCGRLRRLPGKKRQPRASGSHRAAAPPESCALRLPRTREVRRLCVLAPATRKAAAAQLLLEALCTARATRKAARKLSVQ